ncbi:hypothetical protein M1N22_01700 [Dehalococcoidia bacterium]|nr:hypothetical protein [Dehalococcoidia bacterium]MCL0048250.1 hypothetical protein [Dehalococcoidia bacterium]MCL0050553.1 hypothetical protein [Dehalococcoidia bacterium]MCL0064954.1 hypothetical protein [Dehalococcoidia bacterium]
MGWEQISFSFVFGAFSSIGVCLATCTPILIAYLISTEKDPRKFIGWFLLFIGMRAVAFIALTLLILLLGRLALDFIKEYALVLHIVGGTFIAAAGALIFFNIGTKLRFFRTKSRGFLSLAMLFGIKPCLPHIGIWGYILTAVGAPMVEGVIVPQEAIFQSAVIAVSFSLGENIVPIILGGLGGKSIRYFRGRGFGIATKAGGVVLFILGIAFIFYERVAPVIARIFA